MINVAENIYWIKSGENPLSSDVYIIKGNEFTWVFDTGDSFETLEKLKNIPGKKNVIISHFHKDHMGNLKELSFDNIYASKYTAKYIWNEDANIHLMSNGDLPSEITINDGVLLRIFLIPSGHAKGCVAVIVDNKYIITGDAIYPGDKKGEMVYDRGHVLNQIKIFGEGPENIAVSHKTRAFYNKDAIIRYLLRLLQEIHV